MNSKRSIRRQVTLYVPPPVKARIDAIRERYNPAQHALIAAHVTLCRDEDDIDWEALERRAEWMSPFEVRLRFGAPVKEENLVYLPVVGSTAAFDALRCEVLEDPHCRRQEPHITLVHPRNGTCTDKAFAELHALFETGLEVTFEQFTLIRQIDGGPWENRRSFPVGDQDT